MKPFAERYADALADDNIATGLLAFQRSWRESRDGRIAEVETITGKPFDELRAELATAKRTVRADWDAHAAAFARNAGRAGANVVRVADAAEANAYVVDLCRRRGVEVAVKGKSMVSEEIGLNAALEAAGVAAIETDLGEWLLQLAGEHPSHLVMPAIHKRRGQVAELLTRVLGRDFPPDDIPHMVRAARTELREKFLAAGLGLTGANALVADTGAVMLVCNEGNNRMSVALPPIHVVTAGPDKLLPTTADAIRQVRLLARSATAQPITTYTNFVQGPRPGQEQHVLLIDNGRSELAADPRLADALNCIRCGACANVCPPYAVVGGHAFGHVYTGAIGLVVTPAHHGVEAAAGPQSLCVSCGACATVCPVEIPLPSQILEVRARVTRELGLPPARRLALRAFASPRLFGAATRAAGVLTRPLQRDGVTRLPWPRSQTSWRSLPAVPARPARARRELTAAVGTVPGAPLAGRRVTLFLQCLSDRLAPDIAVATARLLRALGAEVRVPRAQHCCGLPAYDMGERDTAARMARQTLDALEGDGDVVTPAPSCAVAIRHDYARMLDGADADRARALAARTRDLVSYLSGPARIPAGALADGAREAVTVHRFCQSGNVLGHTDELEELLRTACRVPVRPLPEKEVCCGFGGSVSLTAPEVSAGILERKLGCVAETGVGTVVTDNPGCILHLRGGAHASGRDLRVVHVAEYLAARLPQESGQPPAPMEDPRR